MKAAREHIAGNSDIRRLRRYLADMFGLPPRNAESKPQTGHIAKGWGMQAGKRKVSLYHLATRRSFSGVRTFSMAAGMNRLSKRSVKLSCAAVLANRTAWLPPPATLGKAPPSELPSERETVSQEIS